MQICRNDEDPAPTPPARFEAKNYAAPKAADFTQVASYLNQRHYGTLGFLVTHGSRADVAGCGPQVRAKYANDGRGKLVIVLPSECIVEMLEWRYRGRHDKVEQVLTDTPNQHLLEYLAG